MTEKKIINKNTILFKPKKDTENTKNFVLFEDKKNEDRKFEDKKKEDEIIKEKIKKAEYIFDNDPLLLKEIEILLKQGGTKKNLNYYLNHYVKSGNDPDGHIAKAVRQNLWSILDYNIEDLDMIDIEKILQIDRIFVRLIPDKYLYIKKFFEYLHTKGVTKNNLAGFIKVKSYEPRGSVYEEQDIENILQYTKANDYEIYRIFILLISTGLRIAGLYHMKYSDFDGVTYQSYQSYSVKYHTEKYNDPEKNFIQIGIKYTIEKYRDLLINEVFNNEELKNNKYLFFNILDTHTGERITKVQFCDHCSYRFSKIRNILGLQNIQLKDTRSTYCDLARSQGIDNATINKILKNKCLFTPMKNYANINKNGDIL